MIGRLSVSDIKKRWMVSTHTIHKAVADGELHPVREHGNWFRFDPHEVARWVRSRQERFSDA